jgi:hypothetical protein
VKKARGSADATGLFFAWMRGNQDQHEPEPIMRAVFLLLALLFALSSAAFAADDVAVAQTVIRSQVEAFSHDDAATAYSYAAPAIQELFPQPDLFLGMVQHSYTPVYRHKSFEFGEARAADGKIAQLVRIVDAEGVPWEALYTLEQEPDGSFKISGCVLIKAGQGA